MEKQTSQSDLVHEVAAGTRRLIEEAEKNSLKGEALVCCTVSKDLLQDFQDRVVYPHYPGGISEAVSHLMRAAVQKTGPKAKHPFVEHREFHIPRSAFILFTLPPGEWDKLKEWTHKHEDIFVSTSGERSAGEVILINETRLDRLQVEKLQGAH
ncbi:MAG: hypothetical protein WCD81_10415 [Candidatus Bathyarchaeia archaeon]